MSSTQEHTDSPTAAGAISNLTHSLSVLPQSFSEKQRLMGMLLILWALIGVLDYLDLRFFGRAYPVSVLYVLVIFPAAIVFGLRGLLTATVAVVLMYHLSNGKTSIFNYSEAEVLRLAFIVAIGLAFERIGRDRRNLREALAKLQQQTRAREDLTHMLVHDLRTPLTGIITSLQTLQHGVVGDLEPDQMEMVDFAVSDGQRLLEMVNQILDVSKLEAGEMPLRLQKVELSDVADKACRIVTPIAEESGINLHHSCNGLKANMDPELIRRVLVNLLGNALKFTPRGGDVSIQSLDGESDHLAHLIVRDTGRGIPASDLKRVFEKYAQSNGAEKAGPSTGIGLTFCRLAVEAHGGHIWAQSELGQGTEIHITMPIDGPSASAENN